jgi:hypothetical protein
MRRSKWLVSQKCNQLSFGSFITAIYHCCARLPTARPLTHGIVLTSKLQVLLREGFFLFSSFFVKKSSFLAS